MYKTLKIENDGENGSTIRCDRPVCHVFVSVFLLRSE